VTYHVRWTAYGAAFWAVVNLVFMLMALFRISSDRFASERRTAVRLQIGTRAHLEGRVGRMIDVSMGGAMVRCESPPEHRDAPLTIEFNCAGSGIVLRGEERGRRVLPGGSALIRLQFSDHQAPELARLATALFGGAEPTPTRGMHAQRTAA